MLAKSFVCSYEPKGRSYISQISSKLRDRYFLKIDMYNSIPVATIVDFKVVVFRVALGKGILRRIMPLFKTQS